jgi:hypothetical protein
LKNPTPRFALRELLVAQVVFLTACAGGGGGGGGGNNSTYNPTLRSVPYSTPVRVDAIKPMNSTAFESDSSALISQSLSGNGEELITAGRSGTTTQGSYPTYNLNVFGWSNGSLVNRTSQWFSGNDNVILGTEPSIKFADFDGDGKKDMYVASNTDTTPVGSGWVYFNNGSNFTRVDLNLGVTGHDSAVYDLNGDGRSDIYTTGGRVSFSNANRTFTSHNVVGAQYPGVAGSVAIADFMGNGGSTILLTDQNSWQRGNNRLYSWEMIDGALNGRPGAQDFNLNLVATLPDSRFFLPKWSSYGFSGSHDYRALAFDFDNSGLTSAVVFSRPALTNGVWPDFNEIQFLKNRGGGTFIDVTDTTLVGYNTSSPTAYNPKLMDVNSDGLTDIVLSGTLNGAGAQVLIHTTEHKYVASYSAVIDAFVAQSATLEKVLNASAEAGGNGIVFVKGPDGSMYLATAITYNSCKGNCSSYQEKAIYLSKLGSTTASAQATAIAIKQAWPWMSDGQVNSVLAQSSTTWFGMNILDPAKAFQPIGDLSIPLSGGKGLAPIRGYVMGLGLDDSGTVVTDSMGRGFTTSLKFMNVSGINSFGYNTQHNDQHNLTSHAEYLVNGTPVTYGNMRVATENRYGVNGTDQGANITTQNPTQYSIGIPEVYKKGKFSYGAQYTNLNTNPWIAFGGAWGSITNSGIFDNVVTYRDGGFSTQASLMHVTTNITPGLITKVNNIVGGWAESGYRYTNMDGFGDLGLFAGVKPVVLSGDVEARMPTSVDSNGNITYTNKNLAIQNQVTPYLRAIFTTKINKQTMYRFSAMGTQQGQYRLMNEVRLSF